jgi:hypothetical protein
MDDHGGKLPAVQSQLAWAERSRIATERGYTRELHSNLRCRLSAEAERAFARGSGSETRSRGGQPPKMSALHSSSALAVNVFDYWTGRALAPLVRALGVDGSASSFEFEAQLPTGARGIPPNLDVLFRLEPSGLLGVESKFTEWMTPKSGMGPSLAPYVESDRSFWILANLPDSDRLARGIGEPGEPRFRYLDVPQLLKHALGLRRAAGTDGEWHLRYVYLDYPCSAQARHSSEIEDFTDAVGAELHFGAITYQKFIHSLVAAKAVDVYYENYLRERYLTR